MISNYIEISFGVELEGGKAKLGSTSESERVNIWMSVLGILPLQPGNADTSPRRKSVVVSGNPYD